MTILEASGTLFEWYKDNDTFVLEDDFQALQPGSKTDPASKAAVWCCLLDFEQMEMVKSCEIEGRRYWVLKKGFDAFEQSVTITPMVAITIAGMVNTYCDILEVDSEKTDPTNIEEKDIKSLLFILNQTMDQKNN